MADVIKDALKDMKLADLQVVKAKPTKSKELTKADVEAAIPLLKEVEKNNGYLAIASRLGLTQSQVAEIHKEMEAKISELNPIKDVE